MEQALVHMLNCTEKLFGAGDMEKSRKPISESKQAKNTRRQRHKESEADANGQNDAGELKCHRCTQSHNTFA